MHIEPCTLHPTPHTLGQIPQTRRPAPSTPSSQRQVERLAKSTWPTLRDHLSNALLRGAENGFNAGGIPEAIAACASLSVALSSCPPSAAQQTALASIRAFFDVSKGEFSRKGQHEARAVPALFLSEAGPHDETAALNVWLLSCLDSSALRPSPGGEPVQLLLAKRLASASAGGLASALLAGVMSAHRSQGGAVYAHLGGVHDYAGRAAALAQFSANAAVLGAPPGVFDQSCRFVALRVEEGAKRGTCEGYLCFVYEAFGALVGHCAASMQSCMQGARGTVLHDVAKLLIRKPPPLALSGSLASNGRWGFSPPPQTHPPPPSCASAVPSPRPC